MRSPSKKKKKQIVRIIVIPFDEGEVLRTTYELIVFKKRKNLKRPV